MPMPAEVIIAHIKEALPDAEVELQDLAGDNDHFAVRVLSSAFAGKTRVTQHKMVMDALKGNMGNALHALSIQTGVKA
jgi:stress-induced morphogen